MRALKRSTSAVGLAPVAGTADSYHCKTSSHSVDDPSYSGPDTDNGDVDVTLCAMRAGAYTGPEHALEHSSGNSSYPTGTLKSTAGSGRYLTDGYIQLDWSGDGNSYRSPVLFTASPVV